MNFANRVTGLEPEGAYVVLAHAQQIEKEGKSVIHLEIGQPDFPTVENVSTAGKRAIDDGLTRYTPSAGLPELRHSIAEDNLSRKGLDITAENVVVGPGAKPSLFFPTLALVNPGDEVIYPNPGFPTYEAMIQVAGGIPVPVPLSEENNFAFDLDAFDKLVNKNTRLIVINSPGNPSGGVFSRSALEHISRVSMEYDAWVLSDEIYSRMVYEGQFLSIASLPGMLERTIICDGFSKTFAMTGWRLGFGIMPVDLAYKVNLLVNHAVGSTAHFTQVAGIEALNGPQVLVDEMLNRYRIRRDLLVSGLNKIPGISCQVPQGAFYAFPNIRSFGKSSQWLANYLLEEAGVALLPGTSFGEFGEGFLRICYAASLENIREALDRMGEKLAQL
jgi:aspartate/methionine/tyrosine aminotransferase